MAIKQLHSDLIPANNVMVDGNYIYVYSQEVPLFLNSNKTIRGYFYSVAKILCTIDELDRKYTLKLEGVRGCSYYRWNFKQDIDVSFDTGTPASEVRAKYSIPRADEFQNLAAKKNSEGHWKNGVINGYPYVPKDYYFESTPNLSKQFSFDKSGIPDTCYFTLHDYNNTVYNVLHPGAKPETVSSYIRVDLTKYIKHISATNVVYITDENYKRVKAQPYIYDNGKWVLAEPNILLDDLKWR